MTYDIEGEVDHGPQIEDALDAPLDIERGHVDLGPSPAALECAADLIGDHPHLDIIGDQPHYDLIGDDGGSPQASVTGKTGKIRRYKGKDGKWHYLTPQRIDVSKKSQAWLAQRTQQQLERMQMNQAIAEQAAQLAQAQQYAAASGARGFGDDGGGYGDGGGYDDGGYGGGYGDAGGYDDGGGYGGGYDDGGGYGGGYSPAGAYGAAGGGFGAFGIGDAGGGGAWQPAAGGGAVKATITQTGAGIEQQITDDHILHVRASYGGTTYECSCDLGPLIADILAHASAWHAAEHEADAVAEDASSALVEIAGEILVGQALVGCGELVGVDLLGLDLAGADQVWGAHGVDILGYDLVGDVWDDIGKTFQENPELVKAAATIAASAGGAAIGGPAVGKAAGELAGVATDAALGSGKAQKKLDAAKADPKTAQAAQIAQASVTQQAQAAHAAVAAGQPAHTGSAALEAAKQRQKWPIGAKVAAGGGLAALLAAILI